MLWVAVAWGFALVVTLVILGFCGYEIAWKTKRLSADARALREVADGLSAATAQLAAARARAAERSTKD